MKSNFFVNFILIIFICIIFSCSAEIQNGLYLIKNKENYNLCFKNTSLYFSSEETCQFFIRKKGKKPLHEYDFEIKDKNIYYFIEDELTGKKLYFDGINRLFSVSDNMNLQINESNFLWEILEKTDKKSNESYYEIKSKQMKFFISYKESKEKTTEAYCESTWNSIIEERDVKIKLIQIYKENENKKENEILEKEPIDVVIKYIDLNDEKLKRNYLEQFDKDKQNNELKYSLRSIFKNIPWIRKIFIIMPNEKIDFLNNQEEIKEKIVYIKDSDLLGFDSSSPPAFQFNIHKLKQYNLSENFILMDDDYFIGQPLKKSDLFYELKGKIYPYIISTKYHFINLDKLRKDYMDGMNIIDEIKYNSKEGFEFRKTSTLLFLYKILDDNYDDNQFIEVEYTHNTIPLKLSDVEEIYNSIEKDYKYSEYCLRGNKRNLHNLQPQILFTNYAKNKYNRLVNKISYKYYDLSDIDKVNLDNKLFVINREDKEYEKNVFKKEEEILEKLFPEKIKYENDYIEIKQDNKEKNEIIKDDINKKNENEELLDKKEKNKEEEKITKEENHNIINNQKLEEKINKLENEIYNQNKEYKDKFDNILGELKTIKTELEKNTPYDTILSTKLQTMTESLKDLNEKFLSLEKENKDLKKAQKELSEKALNNILDKGISEKDNNSLKEIFDAIKEKNTKLEEKLNIISEINNSLTKKLNLMQENVSDKEKDISKLTQENLELKTQIKEFESLIENNNKNLENLLEQNQEKINKLNIAIDQLKQNLNENKIEYKQDSKLKDEKEKTHVKVPGDYSLSYIIVFLFICVLLVYAVYKIYYAKGGDDSKKIKHMKLSSHSGYGSISSNAFM